VIIAHILNVVAAVIAVESVILLGNAANSTGLDLNDITTEMRTFMSQTRSGFQKLLSESPDGKFPIINSSLNSLPTIHRPLNLVRR